MYDDLELEITDIDKLVNLLIHMLESTKLIIELLHQITKYVMIYNNILYKKDISLKKNTITTIEQLWEEIIYNINNSSYDDIPFYLINDKYNISYGVFNVNDLDFISIDYNKTNYENNISFTYQLISKNDGITGSDNIIFKYINNNCQYLEYNINKFNQEIYNILFEKGIYLNIQSGIYLKSGFEIFISVKCNRYIIYHYKNEKIILEIQKIVTPEVDIKISNDINGLLIKIETLIKRISMYHDYLYNKKNYVKNIDFKNKNINFNLYTTLQTIENNNLLNIENNQQNNEINTENNQKYIVNKKLENNNSQTIKNNNQYIVNNNSLNRQNNIPQNRDTIIQLKEKSFFTRCIEAFGFID